MTCTNFMWNWVIGYYSDAVVVGQCDGDSKIVILSVIIRCIRNDIQTSLWKTIFARCVQVQHRVSPFRRNMTLLSELFSSNFLRSFWKLASELKQFLIDFSDTNTIDRIGNQLFVVSNCPHWQTFCKNVSFPNDWQILIPYCLNLSKFEIIH